MSQRNSSMPSVDIYAMEPGGASGGNSQYPPGVNTQNNDPEKVSDLSDGSEHLFSMYLERAMEEDNRLAESWQKDADGILVFTGLFSAAVATLLSVTIQNLLPNSQDTSAFYLARIDQSLSKENVDIPSSLTSPAASFTPSTAAVWVNLLWFLSLAVSLTCALLATLLQQWARRYLRITQPRYSPHKRARIRAFFAEGVERRYLPWTVEALPTLLHISLFLFFAGLCVFLFGLHRTIFKAVTAWVALCVVAYAYAVALPILYKDSPYHAPLSPFIWYCVVGIRYAVFRRHNPTPDPEVGRCRSLFQHSLLKRAEEHASGLPAEIDHRSLWWTFDSLDEDRELEQFFEGVPGFCDSSAVENSGGGFIKSKDRKLSDALIGLMDRTLASSLVSESTKQRRITICTKAMSAADLFGPWWILPRVLHGKWQAFLRSIDFGLFLKGWSRVDRPITTFYSQCAVAVIISSVPSRARDDRWFQLVTQQIDDVSKSVLRSYLAYGDSIQLANLIHIVRQTLRTTYDIGEHYEAYITEAFSRTLESVCKLDARGCLPDVQRAFCNLWNDLVHAAQHDERLYVRNLSLTTLKNIHKVYIALHRGPNTLPMAFATADDCDDSLDDVDSYPICIICSHDSALPAGGPPDLHGQATAEDGDDTQPPVSLPVAVPSPVPASTASMLPTPSPSPPIPSILQVFPDHHNARPTDTYATHDDCSALQTPSTGTSIAPSHSVPQRSLTPDPYTNQCDP